MLLSPRALAIVAGILLAASAADAQPNVAADLVKRAIAKSQAGDHLSAIELYLQAYAIDQKHALLSNVGSEYHLANKPYEALKYFCMYLDKDPGGANATYAMSKAKALQIELGNKDIDDKTVCKPRPEPRPKVEPPPAGRPEASPGVPVTGGVIRTTTGPGLTAPTGPTGGSGGVADKSPVREPGRGLRLAGLGVGVGGLAAIGVGVVFGLRAKSISDEITNHCEGPNGMLDPCPAWEDDIKDREAEGQSLENRQIILSVAGGAALVAGTVLYMVGRSKKSSAERLTVAPTATTTTVGVTLSGAF